MTAGAECHRRHQRSHDRWLAPIVDTFTEHPGAACATGPIPPLQALLAVLTAALGAMAVTE